MVKKNEEIARLTEKQISSLKNGDIKARLWFFSDMISERFNRSPFDVTHAGILYKKGKAWYVIHSLSSNVSDFEGVQEQPLSEFLKYSMPHKILVVRAKGISEKDGNHIVEQAQFYLNKKTPFDIYGKIDDASQLYCTELVLQILENDLHLLSFPKEKKQRQDFFYHMKSMYDSHYFDVIVNTYPR